MIQEAFSTVTVKNQTTIPKLIRQSLTLEPGDRIKYIVGENGSIQIIKDIAKPTSIWELAYQQEREYGSFDTPEIDWGADLESEDFD